MSLNNFIEDFKALLSISDVPIILKRDPTNEYEAELEWHPNEKLWCIWYKDTLSEYYIIHELGHLYFAKILTHFEDFALQTPFYKEIDKNLYPLFNNILDAFIDYNLSKFNAIYPILKMKIYRYLTDYVYFKEIVDNQKDFIKLLSLYSLFFLGFKFILKKNDRESYSKEIIRSLNCIKLTLNNIKPKLFSINFKEFNEILNKFDDIKEEKNPKLIVLYMINVVFVLDYWSKKELLKQINLFFPGLSYL